MSADPTGAEPVADRLFTLIADKVSDGGTGPAQLRANLGRVVSDANVCGWCGTPCGHMHYWHEAFQLPTSPAGPPPGSTRFRPPTWRLDAAIARGQGVVFSLPRSSSWDMAGIWLVDHFGQFAGRQRLKPESLFDASWSTRVLGFEVSPSPAEQPPSTGSGGAQRGGVVCLLRRA